MYETQTTTNVDVNKQHRDKLIFQQEVAFYLADHGIYVLSRCSVSTPTQRRRSAAGVSPLPTILYTNIYTSTRVVTYAQ